MSVPRVVGLSPAQARARLAPGRLAVPWETPMRATSGTTGRGSVTLAVNGTTAHEPGAWVELVSATTEEMWAVVLRPDAYSSSGVAREAFIDIGIGAAASEVAIVTDVDLGYTVAGNQATATLPVVIPVGSRVAARLRQSSTTGASFNLVVDFISATNGYTRPVGNPVSIGADTANTRGTALTAPGAANAKSAWTEITAATTQPFSGILLNHGGSGAAFAGAEVLIDVGIGAAGAEQVILANHYASYAVSENITRDNRVPIPGPFPAGTRIAIRFQRSAAAAVYAHVHGIP